MKNLKSHFRFNKQERSGIFFLLSIIFSLQIFTYLSNYLTFDVEESQLTLNQDEQRKLDSLLAAVKKARKTRLKSFNPNYISDFKGYELGMNLEELDRLHQFRASGMYIRSADQFQNITGVHDTLLAKLSPYFRFPKGPAKYMQGKTQLNQTKHTENNQVSSKKDLNKATEEDLKKIHGIGEVLSARIVKFRKALGEFRTEDQLYDVYGLDSAVVIRVMEQFTITEISMTESININTATANELSQNIYITTALARQIIRLRDSLGKIDSLHQLTKIQDFPSDKIERIKLYLTL